MPIIHQHGKDIVAVVIGIRRVAIAAIGGNRHNTVRRPRRQRERERVTIDIGSLDLAGYRRIFRNRMLVVAGIRRVRVRCRITIWINSDRSRDRRIIDGINDHRNVRSCGSTVTIGNGVAKRIGTVPVA